MYSLTIIITTSPTPSAPSTELLSSVIQSFHDHCPDLLSCQVIVVFDTYDHISPKARLKKGYLTPQGAKDYDQYKSNVKELVLRQYNSNENHLSNQSSNQAEYGSPGCAENFVSFSASRTQDSRIVFIEPAQRLGFSLAVRTALRTVTTPYVWVHQHDWTLLAQIPIAAILEVMKASEPDEEVPIKYVCLPSIRMLQYAVQSDVQRFPAFKTFTASLKRSFVLQSQAELSVPLTPLFFWHDKPHIVSTTHYLNRVFPSRLAVRRGEFIEDTVGQKARKQMKEGQWHKWACWLYYPNEGKQLCLKHLDGRVWRGVEGEMKQKMLWKAQMQIEGTAKSELLQVEMHDAEADLKGLFASLTSGVERNC
ncbi:hypothetical protein H2198_004610 [Neophaeococcomyces mojaviensis]|uniref:Uncharacterized protein n=1 Tax=Neophaeococcomyces mojaviensis TaxID=3383035 RepID=A0ACC3A8N6_9EURO|nr:hypothetical protein H2198_004610 [Knufia sp. JES_112]